VAAGKKMNKVLVYKTEGIIIKAADLGELDRLLTIYTKGYGKIQARAISARKKTSKLNSLLQSFTHNNFLLVKSKTIDIVTDVEVINSFNYLYNSLNNLAYAFYFSELIDKLIPAPERDENIWRLVSRVFEVLNQKRSDLPKIRLAFEDKLVEFLGQPSLKLWLASHPSFAKSNKNQSIQRLNYLQSLAGERFNSYKFLSFVKQ
jgi:DNA repair protein RecO (recombination protein O)